MIIRKRIDRRTILRSAGLSMSMPLLDIMNTNISLNADSKLNSPPNRFIWLFQPNGVYPKAWNPVGEGLGAKFPKILQPFEPFKNKSTIFRNLCNNGNFHAGNVTSLLTGKMAEIDHETGHFEAGKSIDQYIADKVSATTPIRSLELGIDSPPSGPCALSRLPLRYGATLSWETPIKQRMVEVRPLNVYKRLFGVKSKSAEQALFHSSILDLVKEEAKDIKKIGSISDGKKIEEYLDSVRTTERGLQRILNPKDPDWIPPTHPNSSDIDIPPIGVPLDRTVHMKSMLDLLTLALWTDSTRVSTFLMGATQCNAHFGFLDGVVNAFHEECSHHAERDDRIKQYVAINHWHASQAAYLMKRLDSIDEGGQSLLDHSLIFFGSSLKDGQSHSRSDLPIAMFGTLGGKVKPQGHFILPENTPMSHLHQSTLSWYGIKVNDFNETNSKSLPNMR